MKTKLITSIILLGSIILSGCSPTPIPQYRNYFYSGMSSFCANQHSVEYCTKSIQTAINNKEYEKITVPFTSTYDAFYLGMVIDCLDYEENTTQKSCTDIVDKAMADKYFEQLGNPPIFPTAQSIKTTK